MKFVTLLFLVLISSKTFSSLPLDIKLGLWEYEVDLSSNPMMKVAMDGIKNLPKAQRDMIMKKMGATKGLQKSLQCFTKDDMNNWEKKISKSMNKEGCKLKVKKSTKKVYHALMKCKSAEGDIDLLLTMTNNKKGTTFMRMSNGPMPSVKVKMKWLRSDCSKK